MEYVVLQTAEEIGEVVAQEIATLIKEKPQANICIAAGHSSLWTFEKLVEKVKHGELSFSQANFTAMDEWAGMNETDSGSCGDFLVKHFLSQVDFCPENISLVNGRAVDPQQELERIASFIREKGGIDYMVLGVGMNGHLALNEPGTSFTSGPHLSQLDEVTCTVGAKYFEEVPSLTGGVTIGLGDICRTGRCVLTVNGVKKAPILHRFLDSSPTEELPVTVLKTIENCTVYCDKEAAGETTP